MPLERYKITFYFRRYKMKDKEKTKKQLIDELAKLRQRITRLEELEANHRRTEEALRDSEEKYYGLFDYSTEFIYILDSKGTFVEVNRAAEALTGYSKSELIGMNFKDYIPPEYHKRVFNAFHNIFTTGKQLQDFPLEVIVKDGTKKYFETNLGPLRKGEQIIGFHGCSRDITKRKLAEEKIKASLEEKEVMLREIHHRVKNNMQIMSSLLRLQSGKIKDKKTLEIFKTSQSRIRSMAFIHESLYKSEDLARIDFSDYTSRVTTHLFSLYGARTAPINYKVEVKDVFLDINTAIPCGLIINELVTNSLKHAFPDDRRGEILVKMRADKRGKHTLIVKDTGIGFPERLDFRETETLGMQLVTDLVIQIEGSIKLNREGGTTFTIVF